MRLLTSRDGEALDVLRHSAAHVMARAVMRLYKGVSLAFGPVTDNGFYYDFHVDTPISEDDFPGDRGRDQKDHQAQGTVRAVHPRSR